MRDSIRGGALADRCGGAALESGPGYGEHGRYSLFAANPRAEFEVVGGRWRLLGDAPFDRPSPEVAPLEALRTLLRQTAAKPDEGRGGAIFQGGWIGFIGYDLAPLLERLPRRLPRTEELPDLHLAYYDVFAVEDRATGRVEVYSVDRFGDGEADRRERALELSALLSEPELEDVDGSLLDGDCEGEFSPEEYCWAVERVVEYLKAGDIFQANLSQKFSGELRRGLAAIWRRARRRSPAPFSAMLRGRGWGLVSTSPERFLLVEPDGRVETRPIKGTRPRGRSPVVDLYLRDELFWSVKDDAELTMIVDLERNDLGRVCEFGSVRVAEHRRIESFANVHHLVSTVEGRLAEGRDFVDLLSATFPGGSVTGAPKVRAMEIIDELERSRRGAYTGAIGYISDHGRVDLNVAIRTIVVDGERASYRVGGGVVADSDPVAEYRETLVKGRRLRSALLGED